jgi:deoxyribose-phosphate aldolase
VKRSELAALVDHTLLRPEATDAEVAQTVADAARLGAATACVSPSRLPLRGVQLPAGLGLCAVVGFPSGAHRTPVKAAEAAQAVDDGATEVDMVLDLGAAAAGDWTQVRADVAAVRDAVPAPLVLKVIIEAAALTDQQVVAACEASEAAGADFVKTSTGFSGAGGASVAAVRLMAATVGGRLGVKASGGIRDTASALAMVDAGATRLGLSGTEAVLAGLDD